MSGFKKVPLSFFFIAIAAACAVIAWYFLSFKLNQDLPPPQNTDVVVVASPALPAVVAPTETPPLAISPNCSPQPEYAKFRKELGEIVNNHMLRQYQKNKFAAKINKWRKIHGLPLSFGVNAEIAERQNIVFNNCNPSCGGQVHQVFAAQVDSSGSISVLTRSGKLKKIQIHKSGLEVLTLTELNKKGVPFQSWKIPMDPGPWYISKGYIFKDLDIEGLQLQIPTKGAWSIAQPSKDRVKLQEIDPVKGLGCVPEELCLTTPDNKRFFRLPPVCGKEPVSDSH